MKKKTSIVAGLILLFLIVYSCEQEDQSGLYQNSENGITDKSNDPLNILLFDQEKTDKSDCDNIQIKDLFAGQDTKVGEIIVKQGSETLTVTYDVSSTEWKLEESHLFVGDIHKAPFTNSGNPKIGNFPYQESHDLLDEYSYEISLEALDPCFSVITHAVVVKVDDAEETDKETAFGFGDHSFDGNRWGWYLDFCKIDCEENNLNDTSEKDEDSINADSQDTTENDPENEVVNENGCMDAFAFDKRAPGNSICFYEDFSRWGWSNYVGVNEAHTEPVGFTYTYPVFASAFQCDITNSMEVGTLNVHISGGDGIPYASITLRLINPDLMIESFHFYVGKTAYPIDKDGQESIHPENYTVSLNSLNTSSYTIDNIQWYEASYFISQIKVCPKP
ncbi:hypothetical protein [Lutimonas sp.]|uniref:hypothetical protein n=1 Tax=Lutimonas sp. TaxID=1872403 RepID=UPI003D9B37D1